MRVAVVCIPRPRIQHTTTYTHHHMRRPLRLYRSVSIHIAPLSYTQSHGNHPTQHLAEFFPLRPSSRFERADVIKYSVQYVPDIGTHDSHTQISTNHQCQVRMVTGATIDTPPSSTVESGDSLCSPAIRDVGTETPHSLSTPAHRRPPPVHTESGLHTE